MNRKAFSSILVLFLLAAFAAVIGVWYHEVHGPITLRTEHDVVRATTTIQSVSTSTALEIISTSTAYRDQYGLFVFTTSSAEEGFAPSVTYKDDGVIATGSYVGYHRLVGEVMVNDQTGGGTFPEDFLFATNNYQSFVFDPNAEGDAYSWFDVNAILNLSKIIEKAAIPLNHPAKISLGNFVLVRGRGDLGFDSSSSGTTELISGIPGLRIFSQSPTANVVIEDQQGAAFNYSFISIEDYNRSISNKQQYPSTFYLSGDFASSSSPTFTSYASMGPFGCANLASDNLSIITNVSTSTLASVTATKNGVNLYAPKDTNSAFDRTQYEYDVTTAVEVGDMESSTAPTYQQYVVRNPILLFQDPWGRWVGLGENQYAFQPGCGKPVIYLYPTKPTEVTVQFEHQMHFSVNIPMYAGKWDVLANPNGELQDLQPQFTNCDAIDYDHFGSEYAKEACVKNTYPYLYWAGQTKGAYPNAQGGWIVAKNDLASFLDGKLAEMGLDGQERKDMTGYWVPELLKKDASYYRISFFQTAAMNRFIPMRIVPRPDTMIRVFLDWSPLNELPGVLPVPETLTHTDRNGFTIVEWGGLQM